MSENYSNEPVIHAATGNWPALSPEDQDALALVADTFAAAIQRAPSLPVVKRWELLTSVLSYGFGFVFATALLHAIGAGIGIAIANTSCHYSGWIVRISGAAMAIDGLVLLASR